MTIQRAIATFAAGYSFTRSITYPCTAEEIEAGLWVVRDAPRRDDNYRGEEYIASGVEPCRLDAVAKVHTRGRYHLCHVLKDGEPHAALAREYEKLGYLLNVTESFMVHDLKNVKKLSAPVEIVRVTTQALAAALSKAARRRQMLPEHSKMSSPPIRNYVAMDRGEIVGWVGSVAVDEYAWCTNMYVKKEFRRRGIGKALLFRMLADDRYTGATANLLLANHQGAQLYHAVGYREIAKLYAFVPKETTRRAKATD